MDAFDSPYWNLCQAAVWIEFRDRELVEQFAAPEGQVPDGEAYRALHHYPSMWPAGRKLHGNLSQLHELLKLNSIKALGYSASEPDHLQVIPSAEWHDIDLRPPLALDARNRGKERWTLVRVKRADMLRIWRPTSDTPNEEPDRSWFNWEEIRKLYDAVRADDGTVSERQTILEIQARFEKRHKKKAPGRTALQNRIKQWKIVAT